RLPLGKTLYALSTGTIAIFHRRSADVARWTRSGRGFPSGFFMARSLLTLGRWLGILTHPRELPDWTQFDARLFRWLVGERQSKKVLVELRRDLRVCLDGKLVIHNVLAEPFVSRCILIQAVLCRRPPEIISASQSRGGNLRDDQHAVAS